VAVKERLQGGLLVVAVRTQEVWLMERVMGRWWGWK
jgi:hypothetical protein